MSGIEWPWSGKVQPMLQSEAAECGLACLAMIAAHHGHRVNIGGLRRRFPISMKGLTLEQLISVASGLHLAPRALRLELSELDQLALPAILHWDMVHFVVLEAVGKRTVTILDPATGRRTMSLEKVSRHLTGVALELTPTSDFKPVNARVVTKLSDLWGKLVNFRSAFVQVLLLSLLLQLTALALPFFMQLTIDEAIGQSDLGLMSLLAIGFAFSYLVNAGIQLLRSWVVLVLGQSISFQLGGNVMRHLMRLPTRYFESRHVGDLMSRLDSVGPVQSILTQGMVNAMIDAFLAITTLIVMALINLSLMMIVLIGTVLYLGFRLLIYPSIRRRTEESLIARANEGTYKMESMRSIRAIKLHVHESIRENGWRNRYAEVITASYRSSIYQIWTRFVEAVLFNGQYILVVFVAASAVIANSMSIGVMLAFLSYRSSFMASVGALFDHLERWRLLSVHLERLSDIVSEPREDVATPPARNALLPAPALAAKGLCFAYGANEPDVINDMEFVIPAGSFVAIIGPSGAGKSTLMRLLLGLMPPAAGTIQIDGKPLTPAAFSRIAPTSQRSKRRHAWRAFTTKLRRCRCPIRR
jgi:ATP-binding cassette, subfamily B, bacterial CvaB/MchF/RaxB